MISASRIARLAAAFAAFAAPMIAGAIERCDKNHYILDEPCIPRWTAVNEGLADLDVRVVAVDPLRSDTLYAGGAAGVFKSVDGGGIWRLRFDMAPRNAADTAGAAALSLFSNLRSPPVVRSRVRHVAIDPGKPDTLYAATESTHSAWYGQRRLFKSTDGGETWTDSANPPVNGCFTAHFLAFAPRDPSTAYFAAPDWMEGWAPVLQTTDGGNSWNYLSFPSASVLAIDPLDARTMYAGTPGFEPELTGYPNGVLKSIDGGQTWNATGLAGYGIPALTMDPANPRILYAAAGWTGESAVISKSVDGGDNWSTLMKVGKFHVTALLVDSGDSDTLYVATNGGGISRSRDGGATWITLNDGLPGLVVHSLALVPGNPNRLYAATPAGVFMATD